tara:strand:+ start:510 stop:755 length:246 start_codon:yes stop_codon:yes gene_type:complete
VRYNQKEGISEPDMVISGKDRIVGYAQEDIEYRRLQDELSDSDSDNSIKEKLINKEKYEEDQKNYATKIYVDVRKNLNNFL